MYRYTKKQMYRYTTTNNGLLLRRAQKWSVMGMRVNHGGTVRA